MKPNILAIIPAREGSKRVHHKNFKPFAGTTLTNLAIEQGLQSKYITTLAVSSDSDEVLKITSQYKNVLALKRPSKISNDLSPAIEYVRHAIKELETERPFDIVVILQPSSPLRNTLDIDKTIELLIQNPNADSAVSVVKIDHMVHPYKLKVIDNNQLLPFIEEESGRFASHELPDVYVRNCAVYCTYRKDLETRDDVIGKTSLAYVMPFDKSIDINEQLDFDFAEFLYQRNLNKNHRILIVGDSLALPRSEDAETVSYESTWPYLLKKMSVHYDVINFSIRARNIKHCINDIGEINLIKPSVLIFQVGIVDCAPRIFTPREKFILRYLPKKLRQIVIKSRSQKRKQITSKNPLKYVVTKPDIFGNSYKKLLQEISAINPSTKILIVPILYHHETMESKSPGISDNIKLYNSIINNLSSSSNVKILNHIDIKEQDCFCRDGYHLSELGNYKLLQKIAENI